MAQVIHNAEGFTPALANQVLDLPEIVDVSLKPLGEGVGLMSAVSRAHLTFADGGEQSLIVKYVAQTENAAISKGLNFYKNEVNFYQHLAADCPVRSPRCLFADIDPDTQDFLIVLEDLSEAAPGNQIEGASRAEMSRAFEKAGEMHGQYWGQTSPWMAPHNDPEKNLFRRDAIYKPGIQPTLDLFPSYFTGTLESTIVMIGDRFVEFFERAMSGPQTFIHGDFRTDNMLFETEGSNVELIAVDWQNSGSGRGAHDLAYFSSQSCGHELRGQPELDELGVYHQRLIDAGVKDYSFDECVDDYRYNLLVTMITPIAVCGTLDQGNERGLELGRTMLERSLAALQSMDCEVLVRG